jgi:Na+-transporting methylmalonyl-CoA/oxaloacetate decarboxylase gamma subunit
LVVVVSPVADRRAWAAVVIRVADRMAAAEVADFVMDAGDHRVAQVVEAAVDRRRSTTRQSSSTTTKSAWSRSGTSRRR